MDVHGTAAGFQQLIEQGPGIRRKVISACEQASQRCRWLTVPFLEWSSDANILCSCIVSFGQSLYVFTFVVQKIWVSAESKRLVLIAGQVILYNNSDCVLP